MRQVKAQLRQKTIDPGVLKSLVGVAAATDRLLAVHPLASPEILAALAKSQDQETRKSVMGNPAAPEEALLTLAPEFPDEFFAHPMLEWLILMDPGFLCRLKPGVLRRFLKRDECPVAFIDWASRNGTKGDQLDILKRPDVHLRWLRAIANGQHPKPAERAIDLLIKQGETW